MPRAENVVGRHVRGLPFAAATSKPGHRPIASRMFIRRRGNQMCDRLAVTGDRHRLAALDRAEEFREVRLRFGSGEFPHRLVLTG